MARYPQTAGFAGNVSARQDGGNQHRYRDSVSQIFFSRFTDTG